MLRRGNFRRRVWLTRRQAVRHAESQPAPPDTNLAGPALKHGRYLQAQTHRHAAGTPGEGRLVMTGAVANGYSADLRIFGGGAKGASFHEIAD
jgi:hypothetical protein